MSARQPVLNKSLILNFTEILIWEHSVESYRQDANISKGLKTKPSINAWYTELSWSINGCGLERPNILYFAFHETRDSNAVQCESLN